MGCAASTEATAEIAKSLPAYESDGKKIHKSATAGTEAMTSSSHHDPFPAPAAKVGKDQIAPASSTVAVGDITIRYASLSKKGRDPDDTSKQNQDCFGVHERFADMDAMFFGVYDGHGPHGDKCSQFVQRRLPELASDHIIHQQFGDEVTVDQVRASLHMAHTECNDELRLSEINDSYSGTTAITLYIHDGRITVCNVGDSRAVLGTKKAGVLRSVPLSKDQTPHRPDEAARCKRSGARILSFGQINPSEDDDPDVEDPPRVWSKNGNYPGTAFTRSLGDAVAEKIGVFAEPEMLTVKISPNEKLIVLASDGIYDVMSNQEVIDLCYEHKDDPMMACSAVIEKSHKEWMLNEECKCEESASYDDMTVICIFLNDDISQSGVNDQLPEQTSDHTQRRKSRVRQKTLRNLEEMEEN